MKIAVFGTTGQVATELARRTPPGVTLTVIGREVADFSDPAAPVRALEGIEADAVINAVAYTAVDRAESEPDLAQVVNGDAVGALARALAERGTPFLHVSTDYVFDGSGTQPRRPDDPTGPLGVYGTTKLAGETMIRQAGGHAAILRTSWVFGAQGANFVKTMLRLGAERDRLTIVADQVGGPTPAAAIADALFAMAEAMTQGAPGGTFHFAGAPDTSWAGFARAIFDASGLATEVVDIPTADYPTPARRPLNSRLDCETLRATYGIERPDWRQGLAEVLKEIT